MFNGLASFILRYRPLVLVLFVLTTAFMGYMGMKVQLSYENNKLVPEDDKHYKQFVNFAEEFGDDANTMVAGFSDSQLFTLERFTAFYKTIEQVKALEGVTQVLSVASFYNLIKDSDAHRFYTQALPQSLPTTQKEVDALLQTYNALPFYQDLLYQPDSHVSLIVISMDMKVLNSNQRDELIAGIQSLFYEYGAQNGVDVKLSGIPYVRNEFAKMVKTEFLKFTFFAILVTALFLFLFFRSFTNLLIPIFLVLMSVVWSLGIIVLLGYKLTILTGIIPPLMVVIGIPNCIYLINKYHAEYSKHQNQIKALSRIIAKVGPANLLTNFTTAIGFGVFYVTKTTLLVQFGVVTFFSIISISFLTVMMLPVIYSYLPAPKSRHTKHLSNRNTKAILSKVQHIVETRRRSIYFFSLVLVIFSVFGILRLQPLVFVVDDIPSESVLQKDLQFFERHFKGIMPLEIVIDSGEEDGIKNTATLQRINTFQRRIKEEGQLARPLSVVDFLSFANQKWNDDKPKYYRLPNKTTLGSISHYLSSNEDSGSTQNVLKGLVDKDYRKARISIQMADVGSKRMEELTQFISQELEDLFPPDEYVTRITGTSYLFMIGNQYLVRSLFQSVAIAFVLIAIIMGSLFTSFKMIIVSLVPNTIPLLITAGIMGWAEIPLKPSTILVFSIAFGIAIDDTIHFLAKLRQELTYTRKSLKRALIATLQEVGTSLIYTSVVLFFGFIMFAFSDFQGTVALGILTSISLFFALFANIFVLPALILSYEKRLNPRHELKESVITLPNENEE